MDDEDRNGGWRPESLEEARTRIDAIDGDILALLHDRARVVGHIGRLKRESGGAGATSAFRPGREVAMMRALYDRTRDPLAFATVLAVWREIVSGFTAAQVPLAVETVAETARLARDTFGAQAILTVAPSPGDCLTAMARMPGTVAMIPAAGIDWRAVAESGGHVVAATPYAGARIDAYCIAMAGPEPSGDDVTLALTAEGTARTLPGFGADPNGDTLLGGYPVPLAAI